MNTMRPYVPPFSKTMKILIGANLAIWIVAQLIMERYLGIPFSHYFSMIPGKVLLDGQIWQLFTYMFLHSLTSVTHIVFNMLMLWMIGSELEARWGPKFFIGFYIGTGVGAAIIYCVGIAIYSAFTGNHEVLTVPMVGASGAIFGLLLAYGILFGERVMHFMMIFPMKAKFFVFILGGIEVVSLLTSGVAGGEVANLAHLGGLISGYGILMAWTIMQRRQFAGLGKQKKGRSKLRLVVNNEKDEDPDKKGPKYWN